MIRYSIYLSMAFFAFFSSCRKSDYYLPSGIEVITDKGAGIGTTTWTKNSTIVIEGFVFVNPSQVLTIEPGAVIKFRQGSGAAASALIVANGGKIVAKGTKEEPIIFTSILDDLKGSIPRDTMGLWGGIIILGDAPINTPNGEAFVEGIPISEPRGLYGGSDIEHDAGSLSYVSIRYPGTFLHQNNEINGLTLGGVGNKTQIEYIEVINSADDGIEIFGGMVNLKHIVSFNADDDAVDIDYGYQGKMQFVLGIQYNGLGNNLVEISGADNPVTSLPETHPVMANFTLIGNGTVSETYGVFFNRYASGVLVNSLITDQTGGIIAEYTDGKSDCIAQWERNTLKVENNIFNNVALNISDSIFKVLGEQVPQEIINAWQNYFYSGTNEIKDLSVGINSGSIQLIPDEPTNDLLYILDDEWFEVTNFKGAFGIYDWTEGWSSFSDHL